MRSTHANQAQSLRFTLYPLPPSFLPPTFHPPQGALAATSRPASYRATSGQSEPTALMTSPATHPTARLVRPLLPFSHPPPPLHPTPRNQKNCSCCCCCCCYCCCVPCKCNDNDVTCDGTGHVSRFDQCKYSNSAGPVSPSFHSPDYY